MKPIVLVALVVAALALATVGSFGRADPAPPTDSTPPGTCPAFRGGWHVVRGGESLQGIAVLFYGNPRGWRLIAKANDVGMFPAPGTRLRIPALRLADR